MLRFIVVAIASCGHCKQARERRFGLVGRNLNNSDVVGFHSGGGAWWEWGGRRSLSFEDEDEDEDF